MTIRGGDKNKIYYSVRVTVLKGISRSKMIADKSTRLVYESFKFNTKLWKHKNDIKWSCFGRSGIFAVGF